jgi:hypothetical protein
MVSAVPMSRSRGSVSGLALVLLGAWGGLALFIGPYFHSGFTPDAVWHLTTVRVYASLLPGAVVLLAGLVVLATRSRWFGGFAAVVAAAAGAWFVVGREIMLVLNSAASNSVGDPIATSPTRQLLTQVAAYTGVGLLIMFFAALALGRQSIAAHRDHLRYGQNVYQAGTDPGAGLASVGLASAGLGTAGLGTAGLGTAGLGAASPVYSPFQPTETPFQPTETAFQPTETASAYPSDPPETYVGGDTQFPSQYPTTGTYSGGGAERFPTAEQNYPASTEGFDVFNTGPVTYSPGQTKYPPTEQTTSMTVPAEEQ